MTTRSTLLALSAGLALAPLALAAAPALPLTEVTLYRSGVGAFSHSGRIDGGATLELAFDAAELSDVLKTLVVIDRNGSAPPVAAYAPNRGLAAILDEYSLDPRKPLMSLLENLRGEDVRLRTPEGEVLGALFGVEAIANPENGVSRQHVTLLTTSGFKTIERSQILSVEFLDPDLAEEVRDALTSLAKHRDEDQATLEISFDGRGEREALATYVHSAPVWKASYRLVMPEDSGEPLLQAWAIVENQTDQDWEDVSLTVAAGQPVSFTMDLQTPFTPYRPSVAPPYAVSMAPQVFERELMQKQMLALEDSSPARSRELRRTIGTAGARLEEADAAYNAYAPSPSVDVGGIANQSTAAGVEAGAQFLFTFNDPVTLKRGRSAMLPLATEPIDARRVTVYAAGFSEPMQGALLTNTAAIDLMPGPIAVYDSGAYAGDAQIAHVSRGEERLLTFAVDQDVLVVPTNASTSRVTKLTIVDGLLVQTSVDRQTSTYKLVNRDADDPRTVIIEHPKMHGWDLVEAPKPVGESPSSYRFEAKLKKDDSVELTIPRENTRWTRYALADYDADALLVHVRNGAASKRVQEAFQKAAALRKEARDIEQRIASADARLNEIGQDQNRIRENMRRVGNTSELWGRYTAKLSQQENEIESILEERDALRVSLATAQETLNTYLRNLDVS